MKRVLIVSLNFPPSTIASVHRARHMAKHLPAHGWQPHVLAIDERFHKEPPDPGLGALVPPSVVVTRVTAIPYSTTRWLGLGDLALRSMFQLRKAIDRLCGEFQPDVIFMTGWPFYQMLLTPYLRQRHGVPVILDFQDPWVSAEGAKRPKLSKGGLSHRLAVWLEPLAVKHASWITSVSATQNTEMAARYPRMDATRMSAIPIGGDPDDFVELRTEPDQTGEVNLDRSRFNICYVGTFLPRAGEVVRQLFKGAAQLRVSRPDLAAKVRFVFVGTSNQPAGAPVDHSAHRVSPIAEQEGVADLVFEHPPRVPYMEALGLLARADAVVMVGSDEPHYTASKIYPGLMSGRPFLSIFHPASSAHSILRAAGGGVAIAFDTSAANDGMAEKVALALRQLIDNAASLGRANSAAFADFTAHAVAGQFAQAFNSVVAETKATA